MAVSDERTDTRPRPEMNPYDGPGTIPTMLSSWLSDHADRVQIERGDEALTYRDVDRQSRLLARGLLRQGVGKGTHVGLLAPNGPEWLVCWLAITRIGAVAVLLSTLYKSEELRQTIRHSDIQLLLTADRFVRNDYVERLETAFPDLLAGGIASKSRLTLKSAPYLRSIWMLGDAVPTWAAGRRSELEEIAATEGFDDDLLEAVQSEVYPSNIAIMIYTSGSTADPKAVAHTHGAVVRQSRVMTAHGGLFSGDRMMTGQPLFWVGGLSNVLLNAGHAGATLVCLPDPSPATALRVLREKQITHISMWMAQLTALQAEPGFTAGDFARLRPNGSIQAGLLGKVPLELAPNALGMSETFGPHGMPPPDFVLPAHRAGAFAPTIWNWERRIVDPVTGLDLPNGELGELWVRGGSMMDGYYKKERHETFEPDGFLRTGDLCRIMDDGYLYFHGRMGEMIKTSGANVAPAEVEREILELPEVRAAAVTGLPDPVAGEIVVAAVVLNTGAAISKDSILKSLNARLSSYKVPRRIDFIEYNDLPLSASGKLIRPRLKAMLLSRHGAQ